MGCSAMLVSSGLGLMYTEAEGFELLLGSTGGIVAKWLSASAMRYLAWCSFVCH